MRTQRYVLAAALLVLIALITFGLLRRPRKSGRTPKSAPTSFTEGAIVAVTECNIPEGSLKPFASVLNADGYTVTLPVNYQHGMPLVQITFLRRDARGSVRPYRLAKVAVGGNINIHGAHTLIKAVTDDPNALSALRPGREYSVSHYRPVGADRSLSTKPFTPSFRVPEELPPNTVYKVELLVEDEIAQQRYEKAKEAAAEQHRRIAEQEAITITFAEPPDAGLTAVYRVGDDDHESHADEPGAASIVIAGPNPLGGELAVYRAANDVPCLAYIRRLQRRSVTLPEDADVFVAQDQLVDLTVTFPSVDRKRLAGSKSIRLYESADSSFILFFTRLGGFASPDTVPPEQVVVKAIPGTYHLRIRTQTDEEIEIGEVSVSATGPNVFRMELPDEQTSG